MGRGRRSTRIAAATAVVVAAALSGCGSSGASHPSTTTSTTAATTTTAPANTPRGDIGQAQSAVCLTELQSLKSAVSEYEVLHSTPPTSFAQLQAAGLLQTVPTDHALGPNVTIVGRPPCP